MDRQTFFEAQLWLRRVDEPEFQWPTNDKRPRPGVIHILPPQAAHSYALSCPAYQSQSASERSCHELPADTPLTCSGCFHSASRICYFQPTNVDEDQTLLQVELVAVEPRVGPSGLFVRFDRQSVYEIALSAIQSILFPDKPRVSTTMKLPPFGGLDFGNVSLRLWLEPHGTAAADVRVYLVDALRRVETLRTQRQLYIEKQVIKPNQLQDCFRHNPWVVRRAAKEHSKGFQIAPSQILRLGQEALSSDADREALKMVIANITQQRIRGSHTQSRDVLTGIHEEVEMTQLQPAAAAHGHSDDDLTDSECFDLVASLVHVFGEDHQGLRQLLGLTTADDCWNHQGCSRLSGDSSADSVMQKWQRWDEFLQLSNDSVRQPNKRQRTSDGQTSVHESQADTEAALQAAGRTFACAIIGSQESKDIQASQRAATERLRALEKAAFSSSFAASTKSAAKSETPRKNARHSVEPITPQRSQPDNRQTPLTPQAPQKPAHTKTEHMWNFLLESRRALVRQELALTCLPHRLHPASEEIASE